MPFLRLTRDQRGYETTFLLHEAHPGELPRVLYWYRSAPGVRVGRPALDEDAIRAIEEQHPDIEFDWAQILEVGAAMAADIDHRDDRTAERGPSRGTRPGDAERGPQRGNRGGEQERGRRKPTRSREQPEPPGPTAEASGISSAVPSAPIIASESAPAPVLGAEPEPAPMAAVEATEGRHDQPLPDVPRPGPDVLSELVGREIATRLRARYAGVTARIDADAPDAAVRESWHACAAALNPDGWVTPDQILRGVQQADRLFDDLRRDIANATSSSSSR